MISLELWAGIAVAVAVVGGFLWWKPGKRMKKPQGY